MAEEPEPTIRFLPDRRGPSPWWGIVFWILWNFSPAILMIVSLIPGHTREMGNWPSTSFGSALMYLGLLGGPFIIGASAYYRLRDSGVVGGIFGTIFLTILIYVANLAIAVAGCTRF